MKLNRNAAGWAGVADKLRARVMREDWPATDLQCAVCDLATLFAENARLTAQLPHAGYVPIERVASAHSHMPVTHWGPEAEGEGHRVYKQSHDEGCYLCALIGEINSLRAQLAEARAEYAKEYSARLADAERIFNLEGDRLKAQLAEREWRSIDTAPADEARILLWAPEFHEPIVGMKRDDGKWWHHDEESGVSYGEVKPTSWMPLPEPPRFHAAEGEG